jgi:hypothetical protein
MWPDAGSYRNLIVPTLYKATFLKQEDVCLILFYPQYATYLANFASHLSQEFRTRRMRRRGLRQILL